MRSATAVRLRPFGLSQRNPGPVKINDVVPVASAVMTLNGFVIDNTTVYISISASPVHRLHPDFLMGPTRKISCAGSAVKYRVLTALGIARVEAGDL